MVLVIDIDGIARIDTTTDVATIAVIGTTGIVCIADITDIIARKTRRCASFSNRAPNDHFTISCLLTWLVRR